MSSPELNPSRTFITQLLDSLRSLPPSSAALPAPAQAAGTSSEPSTAAASNPLDSAPEAAKKQLLTLHVLFPNEFLPALDLLDRRLVTRFRIRETRDEDAPPAPPPPREKRSTDADTVMDTRPASHGETDFQSMNSEQICRPRGSSISSLAVPGGETSTKPEVGRVGDVDVIMAGSAGSGDVEMPGNEMDPVSLNTAASTTIPEEKKIDEDGKEEGKEGEKSRLPAPQHSRHQVRDENKHESERGSASAREARRESEGTVYYVRSAQPQRPTRFTSASSSSSSTSYDTLTTYQVLPRVWNCSCPAFAFAAFPSSSSTQYQSSISSLHTSTPSTSHSPEWTFGATALDLGIPPVCKHLLACVLAERCEGLFGGFVDERSVGVAEASGWAAGWGD